MQGSSDRGVLSLPEARLKPLAPCQDLPVLSHPWLPACFFLLAETTMCSHLCHLPACSKWLKRLGSRQISTLSGYTLPRKAGLGEQEHVSRVSGCLQGARALYLVPSIPMCSLVFARMHMQCNVPDHCWAGSAGGCKRRNLPQHMHARPDHYQRISGTRCMRQIHSERSAGGQPQHRQHGIVPTRWTPRGIVSLIGMRKSLTLGTYIDDPEMVPSHMGTDPLVTSDAEQATNETRNAMLLGGRAKAQLDISSRVGSRSFSLSDISELLARRFQMSPNRQPPSC